MITFKKSGRIHTAAILVVLGAAVAGGSALLQGDAEQPSQSAFDVATILPEGTLLHVSLDGTTCAARGRELALSQIWHEPEVQSFVKPLLAWLENAKASSSERLTQQLGMGVDDLLELTRGRLTVSVTELDPEKLKLIDEGPRNLPPMVLTFEYPEALETVRKLLDYFEKMVFEQEYGVFKDDVVNGIKVKHFEGKALPLDLWYMVQDKLFILGNDRATFEGLMKRLKTGAGPGSLAADAGFKGASASTRRAGSTVFAYMNPAQVLGAVGPLIEQEEPRMRAQLAPYDDIDAFAYTSSLDGPGFRDRIYVKIRKGSPLEARIPQQSAPLKTHALAPAETGVFMNTMIAIPETFAEIEAQLASMGIPAGAWEMVVGAVEEFLDADLVKDVLPNFGPELALYAAWPGRTLIPDMALMLQVKDQKKLDELIARIKDRTAQIGAISEFEYRGHKMSFLNARTLDQGAFIQTMPPLKPTWTIVSGYLVICPWPQVARNLIRSVVEKRPNLTDQPDFKQVVSRLRADVPEGSQVLSVSYMDLKSIAGFVLDNLAPIAQTLVPADVPLNVAEMPVTETVTKHLFGGAAISYKIGGGYLTDMYSPTGVVAPVAGVLAGAGMVTWMVLSRDARSMGDFMTDRALMQMQALTDAVKLFQLQEARLPTEAEWPDFLFKGSKNHPDPYFSGQIADPWGNPFQYKRLDVRKFDIISLGADGRPGGVGPNADIHARRDRQR